tara:strand:- start:13 stop:258 length:246 start_codon:yes stop_codon:yes gene_type:complete
MDRSYTTYAGADIIDQGKHDVTWEQVREMRDQELHDTDWRAVKDRVLPNEWKEYRELLRTLPQRFAEPGEACDNWPVMPDE